jgi:hypothetical protein
MDSATSKSCAVFALGISYKFIFQKMLIYIAKSNDVCAARAKRYKRSLRSFSWPCSYSCRMKMRMEIDVDTDIDVDMDMETDRTRE